MPALLISDDNADSVPSIAERYDPEPRRDWVRAGITVLLILTFIGIIAFALYSTRGNKDTFDRTKEMIDKLLPALTGLIGTALGFYFGLKSNR